MFALIIPILLAKTMIKWSSCWKSPSLNIWKKSIWRFFAPLYGWVIVINWRSGVAIHINFLMTCFPSLGIFATNSWTIAWKTPTLIWASFVTIFYERSKRLPNAPKTESSCVCSLAQKCIVKWSGIHTNRISETIS